MPVNTHQLTIDSSTFFVLIYHISSFTYHDKKCVILLHRKSDMIKKLATGITIPDTDLSVWGTTSDVERDAARTCRIFVVERITIISAPSSLPYTI
jgi:hypothetical protein